MFYEKLFKQNYSKINVEKWEFLNSQDTKTLTNQQSDLCKNEIEETNLFDSMKSMKNKLTTNCLCKKKDLLQKVVDNFWHNWN